MRRWVLVFFAGALVLPATAMQASRATPSPTALTVATPMASPPGDLPAGPRSNGTGVLPDGRFVTPVGTSITVDLQPQNAVLSRDGRRLYVTSEGYNDDVTSTVPHDDAVKRRYFTVIDTVTHATQHVEDDALHFGVAESPDGSNLYVSEGQTGSVGVFRRTAPAGDPGAPGQYSHIASIVLDPSQHADYPWGLALSPNGKRLYVAGFETNTLTVVDTVTSHVVARVGTGEYPYGVTISPDGRRVYVTNWGMYNQDADPILKAEHLPLAVAPVTIGGYNTSRSSSVWSYDTSALTPKAIGKTRIGRELNGDDVVSGSLPSALALSPDGKQLAVTSSNGDLVEVLDVNKFVTDPTDLTTKAHPRRVVDLRVLAGGPTGAQPDAVAWSPDASRLFVAEGGRNTVAVIAPARLRKGYELPGAAVPDRWNATAVDGRLPTAWYPTALVAAADGRLWIVNNMGLGSGPNTGTGPDTGHGTSTATYIPDTLFGSVQEVSLSAELARLDELTAISDANNGLVAASAGQVGDGFVIPTTYGAGPSKKIKHVFLIIKENRPFDQELADLPGVEGNQNFTFYGEHVTPNTHALARRFSVGDNFYALSETSVDGHYSIDTGQLNEFVLKTTPSSYAGKFAFDHFQTSPENIPQGGFIWANAARHHVPARIYGEGTYVVGVQPEQLGKSPVVSPTGVLQPAVSAADVTYDPTYPSQVNLQGMVPTPQGVALANTVYPFNDEGRVTAFRREMTAFNAAGVMPNLNVMLLFDDHTDGYLPGHPTPEAHIAENDHALGEIVDTISHSKFWKDSAIFVVEDDTQSGQDHVDAHRTFGLAISPWVNGGHVSHAHTSFSSMVKTINLILGLPPTSLQEMTATPMADSFVDRHGHPNFAPYNERANNVFAAVNPTPANAPNDASRQAADLALLMPPGIDKAGETLTLDLLLGHAGALAAHDPDVIAPRNVVQHTLPTGSPRAVGSYRRGPEDADG